MTFYEATRHSFVSRNIELGVPVKEIAEAIGHSAAYVTERYYNHFDRKNYSTDLRRALIAAA